MSFICYVEGRVVHVACWRIKKTRCCFIGVYVQKLHNTLVWSLIKCHQSVWRGENWRRRHRKYIFVPNFPPQKEKKKIHVILEKSMWQTTVGSPKQFFLKSKWLQLYWEGTNVLLSLLPDRRLYLEPED